MRFDAERGLPAFSCRFLPRSSTTPGRSSACCENVSSQLGRVERVPKDQIERARCDKSRGRSAHPVVGAIRRWQTRGNRRMDLNSTADVGGRD